MNKLLFLKKMGFTIQWKLIEIGLFGVEEIPVLLSREDIIEYLEQVLENTDSDEQINIIIELICEKDDSMAFERHIIKNANNDYSNIDVQKRKWRAYLLEELLEGLSQDCLQGLLSLMEFWASMGYPEDCPQHFPNNKNDVEQYFTQSNYDLIIKKNRKWLNTEIENIICSENT